MFKSGPLKLAGGRAEGTVYKPGGLLYKKAQAQGRCVLTLYSNAVYFGSSALRRKGARNLKRSIRSWAYIGHPCCSGSIQRKVIKIIDVIVIIFEWFER